MESLKYKNTTELMIQNDCGKAIVKYFARYSKIGGKTFNNRRNSDELNGKDKN